MTAVRQCIRVRGNSRLFLPYGRNIRSAKIKMRRDYCYILSVVTLIGRHDSAKLLTYQCEINIIREVDGSVDNICSAHFNNGKVRRGCRSRRRFDPRRHTSILVWTSIFGTVHCFPIVSLIMYHWILLLRWVIHTTVKYVMHIRII